jgi:hypothetical protein
MAVALHGARYGGSFGDVPPDDPDIFTGPCLRDLVPGKDESGQRPGPYLLMSSGMSTEPTNPVAPVTRIFIGSHVPTAPVVTVI